MSAASLQRPIRLALDARDLPYDLRGIGRYTRAIVRRLATRDDVDLTMLVRGPFAFTQRRALTEALQSDRFCVTASVPRDTDLVWNPANGTFFDTRGPSVATVHDAAPFRLPSHDPRRRDHEQRPFLRTVATATRFIAVSHFGKSEIVDAFGIHPDRVDVIHHGVDAEFTMGPVTWRPPEVNGKPFVLYIGSYEPRKNLPTLVEAWRAAFPQRDVELVVVSSDHVPDDVIGLRGIHSDRLPQLYRAATAFAFPSTYEGFGMPVLEAMACGTPVVAADASSLPEVGGDAALYVAPHDVAGWANALARVAADPALRQRLLERGSANVRKFQWERSVQEHLDVFVRVVTERAS